MKKIIIILSFTLCLASCTANRHTIGNGPSGSNEYSKYTYDKAKHVYAIYGIFSLGDPKLNLPKHGNYQYQATTNFVDWLIGSLTGGLITTRTEKIFVNIIKD